MKTQKKQIIELLKKYDNELYFFKAFITDDELLNLASDIEKIYKNSETDIHCHEIEPY